MDEESLEDYTVDFIGEMILAGFTFKQLSNVFEKLSKTLLADDDEEEEE